MNSVADHRYYVYYSLEMNFMVSTDLQHDTDVVGTLLQLKSI